MTKPQENTKKENSHSPNGTINPKYKVITIILLVAIAASSSVALFMLPNKAFFSVLLAISALGLIVCYFYGGNRQTSQVERKKYSKILIVEELDRFFSHKKPYLNANFKISDLEKQLGVSRGEINAFTKKRFGTNFNQFVNLWRLAELKRLRSLPENRDAHINTLCVKAGFANTQQYYQAEKERKARKKQGKTKKSEPVIKTPDDKGNDLGVIRKPEITMRV